MKLSYVFNTLILAAFVLFSSCSKEEFENEVSNENQLNINIDGTDYNAVNEKVGGNENCDELYINASYLDKNKIDFAIKFEVSKKGNLLKVWYEEYKLPLPSMQIKSIFITPNFRPLSSFSISNFMFNDATGEVKFDFDGKVFLENNNTIVRKISGKIKVNSLKKTDCAVAKIGLQYESQELPLYAFGGNITQFENLAQQHRFFSNNGYSVFINTTKDLWNYPIGEIKFSEKDIIDNVEFREAIGPLLADQLGNINKQQWKAYQTSGKIIILDKTIENNEKIISGKLFLTIKDNKQLIYQLDGIKFRTGSFIN